MVRLRGGGGGGGEKSGRRGEMESSVLSTSYPVSQDSDDSSLPRRPDAGLWLLAFKYMDT